jgi:type I restriction enzyme S subunit
MLKNATFLPFYFADNQLFSNSETLVNNLSNFIFPLPPLSEQNHIVQKLDELMQYCNELEASIKQSELQNKKLLQQVLKAALRKEPVEA